MRKISPLVALLCCIPSLAVAKLRIVTTTEDLAALAREVGGDFVEVNSIAKGYQDPHFVDAKPSYLLKLKRADLFIQVGLELEVAWVPSLLINARNAKILPGNPGFLEAADGCEILEKPQGQVDRSMGDVHPLGNPHYWLDPANGRVIARSMVGRLSELDSAHAKNFEANLVGFESQLSEKEKTWDRVAAPLKGVKVVTYHRSWPNFTKRFGLVVVNYVEPRPGIPPSPSHVQSLIAQIKQEGVPLLMMEPYFDDKLPRKVAKETGAKVVVMPPSVGAEKDIQSYFDLFDHDLKLLTDSLGQGAVKP